MQGKLSYAKEILKQGNYTLALCNGNHGATITSCQRGVGFLLELVKEGRTLAGYCAADKVVGKGAAFLYVLLGVNAVYAPVMSRPAKEVLEKHGVAVFCDNCPEGIINREGTGPCPVENAVRNISDPRVALSAIEKRLVELRKNSKYM